MTRLLVVVEDGAVGNESANVATRSRIGDDAYQWLKHTQHTYWPQEHLLCMLVAGRFSMMVVMMLIMAVLRNLWCSGALAVQE